MLTQTLTLTFHPVITSPYRLFGSLFLQVHNIEVIVSGRRHRTERISESDKKEPTKEEAREISRSQGLVVATEMGMW